ncbi:MAG: M56 family metallopeptidase [Deltaproteobacteria bacterium]|nr:M56 family metallopeptidase [Deltaproteobacteria bacterium]
MPTESIYLLAQRFGLSTFSHLWQGTVFASLVILLAVTCGRAPARLRYNLYLLASAKFLIPSALVLALGASLPLAPPSWLSTALARVFDVMALFDLGGRWLGPSAAAADPGSRGSGVVWGILFGVWLFGSLGLTLRWMARSRKLRRSLLRAREGYPGEELELRLLRLRDRLGLSRSISLRLSREISKPGVWGVRSPTILLPEAMPEILSSDELDAVLLHELAHVERLDNLASQLSMALRCCLWFHPLIWWLDRRLLAERERACDERVVELSSSPGAYLRGLAKVLHFGIGGRLEGFASVADSDLQRRIAAIRTGQRVEVRWRHRLAICTAVCLLGISSLAKAHFEPSLSPTGEMPSLDGATWQHAACERAYLESQRARTGQSNTGASHSPRSARPGEPGTPCQETAVL